MSISTQKTAICIATYKREDLFQALLDSLQRIELPQHRSVSIRIIDNDFQGSARPVYEAFRDTQHRFVDVSYAIQPQRNIALSRNAALDMGAVDEVVFVDDDETVQVDWLVSLVETKLAYQADAVFGVVRAEIPCTSPRWVQNCGLFDKPVRATGSALSWKETRTSNTLVDGRWFYGEPSLRFDFQYGRSGGSDTELFSRMEEMGARFISCEQAIVSEVVPENRATLGWLVRRYYRNGLVFERIVRSQGTNVHPLLRASKRFTGAIWSMASSILAPTKTKTFLTGFLRIPLAFGGLVGWLTPENAKDHDAYAPRSERALKRVAFLTNIISPYRKPVFENLAKTPGWKFCLFVDAKSEFDRKWEVSAKYLSIRKNLTWSLRRKVVCRTPIPFTQIITLHVPVGLFFNLVRFRPAVVIAHELGVRTLIAALYTSLFRKELVIWAYQSKVSSQQGSWRNGFRRFLLNRADSVVGMGKQARSVLLDWGVPSNRIVDAPNAADHLTLENRLRDAVSSREIATIQAEFGGGRKIALVAGRLVPLKGVAQLLDSWSRLPGRILNQWTLVFVGEGPLKELVTNSGVRNVTWVGHVPSDSIAYWYAAADLHVFASNGDVWGLAVNEASICGTPTLCSIHAGCYDDLIRHGENGLRIDFSNPVTSLTELKAALLRNDLHLIGQQARNHIRSFSIERLANSFRRAVELAAF